MKRIKILLSMLTAVLILSQGLPAKAATVQLDAGTKETTVTITLKELQSFEGVLSVKEKPKNAEITISSVTAQISGSGEGICSVSEDNTKIFMLGMGKPVTTNIKVKLTFTKDGTYVLELDGGRTDAEGVYEDYSNNSKKYLEQVKIVVGKSSSGSTGSSGSADTGNSSTDTAGNSTGNTSSTNSQTVTTNKNSDPVDYSSLQQALKDADQVVSSNSELTDLKSLFDNMSNAAVLLSSDNQNLVDQAAVQIQQQLMDLGDVLGTDKSESANFWKFLSIALLILAISIFIATVIYFKKKKIIATVDYEGAPIVAYNIEDDDI